MHALLIGLISGYFYVACAPVHWSSALLMLLGGGFLLALLLRHLLSRGERKQGALHAFSGAALWLVNLFVGASLSALVLAGYLHSWQAHTLASQPAGFGCEPAAERELIRLEVLGLPSRTADGSRFDARVLSIRSGCRVLLGQRLRVSWKAASWPTAGQLILAQVRLRAVRGSVSPGAFDHELNLARRGIRLGAYVTRTLAVTEPGMSGAGSLSQVGSSVVAHSLSLSMARTRLAVRRALEALPLENRGVLLALLTGDSALMPRETWELLQATGTVHLLVISGLHVGLVGIGLLFFVRALGRLLLRIPAQVWHGRVSRRTEALCTVALLSVYVMFTGAGVAAVRALTMLVVVLVAWSSGRHIAGYALLVAVFATVVLSEPEVGLSQGFWLSFGLVSWLLLTSTSTAPSTIDRAAPGRSSLQGGMRTWKKIWRLFWPLLALHIGCSLILLPGLAWLGLPVAIISPIANLIAVPIVTLLLVPLVLLGGVLLLVSENGSAWVFGAADHLATGVLTGLEWLALVLPVAELPALAGIGYLAVAVLLLVLLLPSPGFVRTAASAVLLIAGWKLVVVPAPQSIPPGQFALQLLDVGQGLAVVIQTSSQTLLYDTGARFPSGFNFVDAVISPALRAKSVSRLDTLMISHHDIDHAGGLERTIKLYDPARVVGGVVDGDCAAAGVSLSWAADGVRFDVLQHRAGETSNDRSCVLVVRGRTSTVVVAGDIEAQAEQRLLPVLPRAIDVLVVPHHGSRTSSTPEFVAALRPALALVSAGFGNRFGHPHNDVVARYETSGAQVLTTAELGTIDWQSSPARGESQKSYLSAREQRKRRWQLGAGLLH